MQRLKFSCKDYNYDFENYVEMFYLERSIIINDAYFICGKVGQICVQGRRGEWEIGPNEKASWNFHEIHIMHTVVNLLSVLYAV